MQDTRSRPASAVELHTLKRPVGSWGAYDRINVVSCTNMLWSRGLRTKWFNDLVAQCVKYKKYVRSREGRYIAIGTVHHIAIEYYDTAWLTRYRDDTALLYHSLQTVIGWYAYLLLFKRCQVMVFWSYALTANILLVRSRNYHQRPVMRIIFG